MNPFVQNQNNNQGNGPNFNQPPGNNNNTGNNLMNTLKQNNPNVPGNNVNVSHPLDEFSSLNNMNQEQNFQNSTVSKDTIKNYNPFDKNHNQNNDQQNNDNFQMSNIEKMKSQMDNSMLGQNPQAQQNISNNNQNVQNNTQNQNFQQNSFQNDNNPMNNNPLNSNNSNNINSQNSQNTFNNNDLQNNMNNNPNSGNNNALNYPDLDNLDPKNIIANKNKEQNNANSNNNQNQISNIGNNQMNNMSNMDMNNQMNNMSNMNMNNQMNNMSNNQMGNMNMNNQINNMGNNNPGMQMNNMENKNQINNSMNNTDNNNQMNNNMNNNNFGVQMSNMNNMSNNNAGIQMSNMNNNNPMNSNMNNNNAGIQMSNMNNNNPMNSNMNNNNAGMQMSNMNNNNAGIQMSNMNNNNFGMQMSNTNNNNNQMNVNEQKYSFSRYQKAAKTGLKNLGDTSYLNAVLQLLGSVRNLSSYFVNPKNKIEFNAKSNSIPLTFVIHRLFTHLYPYPEKPISENYDPQVLWEVLGRYNQVYKSTKRRNPKDLINYLLLNLHRELNPFKTKITTKCDNTNKDQVIKNGMNDFGKSNNTIISNNFYWFEIKSKQCFNCKTSFYDFNNYEILELDIVAANKKYNNAPFTLTDCLNCQNQKIKNLFCEKCQNYQQFQINKNIFSSPVYFIFSLDRGNLDQNLLNIQFKLEEKIDIIQYLDNKGAYSKYQLSGVVSVYLNKNKYVCFGKSPVDKQWYIYDDNIVSNTNINEVINYNSNYGYVPCILLYSYMK